MMKDEKELKKITKKIKKFSHVLPRGKRVSGSASERQAEYEKIRRKK